MIDKHQQLARLSDASLQDGEVDFVAVLALNGQALMAERVHLDFEGACTNRCCRPAGSA